MNRAKTREYHLIHEQLKKLLIEDLTTTYKERCARAFKRYNQLQEDNKKFFLEHGIDITLPVEQIQ